MISSLVIESHVEYIFENDDFAQLLKGVARTLSRTLLFSCPYYFVLCAFSQYTKKYNVKTLL